MKIFLSYKHTWIPENELNDYLLYFEDIVKQLGDEIYIYYFDDSRVVDSKYIINKVKEEIKKADLFIWFINSSQKSEWQLIELWIAEWYNKEILLLVNEEYKDDYFLIYWLNNKILYYKDIKEIKSLLDNYNKWKK